MDSGYYAWMIVATALVLMMTTPALALFYGGMSRSKSVLNMMMMSYVSMGIVGIVFVLWGWSEGFGTLGDGKFFNNPFTYFALKDVDPGTWISGPMFQMTFAVITAALISGAIADRVKLSSWCIFLPIWITLAYLPIAHMVFWGGWISTHLHAQDYAGGTVVHINAGIAGAVLALIIGRRVGWPRDPMKPHNLTLTMVGAGLLWFGWYGFNVGSLVISGDVKADVPLFLSQTGVTFVNTTIATMSAMLAWLVVERIMHGKATSLGAASGVVAGLVAITPACGAVTIAGAIGVGAVSGAACAVAVGLKYKLNLDDSLDVIGVHLVGGIVGTLLIGLLSSVGGARSASEDGLFYGGGFASLGHQAGAAGFSIVWTGVITAIIAYAIKYTIGWRINEEDEVEGIDFAQHGEAAYDLHTGMTGGGTGIIAAATAGTTTTGAHAEGAK